MARGAVVALAAGGSGGSGGGGPMDPRLRKAIDLLQKTRRDLIEEIRRECEANPVLEAEGLDDGGPRLSKSRSELLEQIRHAREANPLLADSLELAEVPRGSAR